MASPPHTYMSIRVLSIKIDEVVLHIFWSLFAFINIFTIVFITYSRMQDTEVSLVISKNAMHDACMKESC